MAFIDYDGDRDLDLIRGRMGDLGAKRADFPLLAFANDGAGRFTAAAGVIPSISGANAFDIEVADFNGDDRQDLFVASRGGPDRLLLGRK
ncbi:FG-GAP repeat domain-containing protein [Devosia sp. A16]|uniref:FG-GAP repeat domain-containing protein n=1 Tax=Devosia sp. A16 TaxID=1736675 RepID=UPI0006D860B5|nr:VCBS repeat-containing protein [Devosia sp. A16]